MNTPHKDQQVSLGGIPTTFRVLGADTGGRLSIVEQTIAPGILFWPHVHSDHDQVNIVLDGELGVRIGDREWTAVAGETITKPRHVPHTVWNAGTTPARILEISAPATFEDYFLALSALGPDDAARAEIQQRYGVSGVPDWTEELQERYGVRL
ncbi:quercetin dioxygenase-like cupin family protein [Streptomyces sp. SAI-135]|jgi:quercetin dioxygenase-like cupin family protein|uniref:cupin domain-containing protein n=1 Tax=unclassified Streptomyces TaxID=2593676 RepID=UPI002475C397|nr:MULTISPECIES: cupin domain-containing protein [unclassified Streptomyces]MDH6523158.1 quercetin dioxygenase-like cupin family protein [Streptomyces sp. SAI-090]MDH6574043.1 quercetin dioxygenase-like cupin family protein [Streptomyces sp. SAI-117]MDH6581221.1 quercetin dioxygenase-like cupin family protein [Streptomyces sp. SAI-133]MDH6613228.1 quercetin dioxygenase-like cupin family protein [Streptomyces sp. SAI-135]